ncbi:Fic family protein [Tistrella mobilis]|uniref:Fic family protein n=1 Tax=Tistrella mobilis TaxID=171437 RepID=UPI0035589E3F
MRAASDAVFPGRVTVFRDRRLPAPATPAGYAALIEAYRLNVPLPRRLFAIGIRHRIVEDDAWRLLTPRHAPAGDLTGHLVFALRYEGLDLAILKRLFLCIGPEPVEALVRAAPTGAHARRIWFLYEWLTGRLLDLPDASAGAYVAVLDPRIQFPGETRSIRRQRVRDNLPGTPDFCPLVFRTEALERLAAGDLASRARAVAAQVPRDLLARTAAFLLLKDSRSSYAIEGEHPPQDRIQRWGRAIGEAGRHPLDLDDLLRLQRLVIGDARFVRLGIRREGGFVGEHDRETRLPLPSHVSARPEDLASLLGGLLAFANGPAAALDPVIAAAVLAFGFVYVHPFEDGNGRLHRYLIHHVLAARGFNPPGVVFPVSAAILRHIEAYRRALESYSERLLPAVEWLPTARHNIQVLNDTADFYRFFDATPHVEFLQACVIQTIEVDLPDEAAFLRRYDSFRDGVTAIVDMPDRMIDLLFRFIFQGNGQLSGRARRREFQALTDAEAAAVEALYADIFGERS